MELEIVTFKSIDNIFQKERSGIKPNTSIIHKGLDKGKKK